MKRVPKRVLHHPQSLGNDHVVFFVTTRTKLVITAVPIVHHGLNAIGASYYADVSKDTVLADQNVRSATGSVILRCLVA